MTQELQKEPFLFGYISPRTPGDEIVGAYDDQTQMWMISNKGFFEPLIDVNRGLAEISTKTESITEADDQKIWTSTELGTKTLSQTEKDDQIQSSALLIEIGTTTKVVTEADDISRKMNNMFL